MLVVFGGDVGSDGVGEEEVVSAAEGYREDVAVARHGYEQTGEVVQGFVVETETTQC